MSVLTSTHMYKSKWSYTFYNMISPVSIRIHIPISQVVFHLKVNRKMHPTPLTIWCLTIQLLHCCKYFTLVETVNLPTWLLVVLCYNSMKMLFPPNFPSIIKCIQPPLYLLLINRYSPPRHLPHVTHQLYLSFPKNVMLIVINLCIHGGGVVIKNVSVVELHRK